MKLSSTVLGAMRGIGGATLIAAAVAGCGGAQEARPAEPQVVLVQPIDTGRDNRNREPEPDEEQIVQPDYDIAVACGRG